MIRQSAGLRFLVVAVAVLALLVPALSSPAQARHSRSYADKDAAVVIDGATGKILYARNANAQRYPASLTKMMTLYLLFERLQQGKITLDTQIAASAHAVAQKPTKLGLDAGDTISVDLAIRAIVVRSANDVAVAIAETLGGTEDQFAELMTRKARALGMDHTTFRNASGLPNPQQTTTAHDLALLGRHVAYDFPQYYNYFSTSAFSYGGRIFETHDNLLARFDGTDGIKTGYTNASGFNLVSSVVRDNRHVIGVVMGGRTARARDNEMMALLEATFARAETSPTLLAQINVPWQSTGALHSGTMVASLEPGAVPQVRPLMLHAPAAGTASADANTEDEDAAESSTGIDNNDIGSPAGTRPAATLVASATPSPLPPTPVPASFHAVPSTDETPSGAEEGDVGGTVIAATHLTDAAGLKHWAVQIGAFQDMATAQAQLALYAERSMDILGQARREIYAFAAVDGQKLFRARFGPFDENEARAICRQMTDRGQTCFAAIIGQ